MAMSKLSTTIFALSLSLSAGAQDHNVAFMGSYPWTNNATGHATWNPDPYKQGMTTVGGFGVEYRWKWLRQPLSVTFSRNNGDSHFTYLVDYGQHWSSTRNEFTVGRVFQLPKGMFVKAGVGATLLEGGKGYVTHNGAVMAVSDNAVGLDHQFEVVGEIGHEQRLWRNLALRSSLGIRLLKVPGYDDPTYHVGYTVMLVPQLGLVWKFTTKGESTK